VASGAYMRQWVIQGSQSRLDGLSKDDRVGVTSAFSMHIIDCAKDGVGHGRRIPALVAKVKKDLTATLKHAILLAWRILRFVVLSRPSMF
jgi:hypothetical protein